MLRSLSESVGADWGKPWRLGPGGKMQCSPNVVLVGNVRASILEILGWKKL